jgi:hypothetical protein
MPPKLIVSLAAFAGLGGAVLAHESALLVGVEDEHHPETFRLTAASLFEFERTDGDTVFSLSPALSIGVHPHFALGISGRFTDERGGFDFESVLPNVQFLWHPKDESIPLHVHVQLGYQFADEAGDSEEHAEEPDAHEGGEQEEPVHEEPVHEEGGHHHDFRSAVHSHGEDLFTGRIELDYRLGSTLVRGGVIGTVFDDGDAEFGYSAGILQRIIDPVHLALDAFGDFDSAGYQEVSATVYYRTTQALQLSAGVGFGLTDETPDSIVRFGVTYRF